MVTFLIIGDLHGVMPKIHTKNFDAIIAPGDICGDDLRKYMNKWIKMRSHENDSLEFEDVCSCDIQEKLERKSLQKGREVLEFLNSFNKPVFIVPGNWDHTPYIDGIQREGENEWEKLKEGLEKIQDIEFKKTTFKGITLIGHGSTSAPEVLDENVPLELFDDEEEFLEYQQRVTHFKRVQKILHKHFQKSKNPIIFLTHNVPYDTPLDIVDKPGTYAHNEHYGSIIAKEMVENFNPLLCIGGHIHEGYGETKLGETLCINAGFGGDVNTLVEIDEEKGKVINIEFLGKNKENE